MICPTGEAKYFCKGGLDTRFNKPPDGQISGLQRVQIPLVSRTRRSVATLLRRAGTYLDTSEVDPDQQRTTPQGIAR
jgi:hypothetical protein